MQVFTILAGEVPIDSVVSASLPEVRSQADSWQTQSSKDVIVRDSDEQCVYKAWLFRTH